MDVSGFSIARNGTPEGLVKVLLTSSRIILQYGMQLAFFFFFFFFFIFVWMKLLITLCYLISEIIFLLGKDLVLQILQLSPICGFV